MVWFLVPDDDSDRLLGFDIVNSERHESSTVITEHPVETGANITDHVRPELDAVSVEGFISNAPLFASGRGAYGTKKLDIPQYSPPLAPTPGALTRAAVSFVEGLFGGDENNATLLLFDDPFDAVREFYEELKQLQASGTVCRLITPFREYESMIIAKLGSMKTPQDGTGATFSIDFKEIRFVDTETVAAPQPTQPRGKGRKSRGDKGAKPDIDPAAQEKKKSILFQAGESLGLF